MAATFLAPAIYLFVLHELFTIMRDLKLIYVLFPFWSISISYFFSLFLSNFAIVRLIVMGIFPPEFFGRVNNFWMFRFVFFMLFSIWNSERTYIISVACWFFFFRDIVTTILLEIQLKWWKIKTESNENKSGKIILMVHKIKHHCPWVMVEVTKTSLFTLLLHDSWIDTYEYLYDVMLYPTIQINTN